MNINRYKMFTGSMLVFALAGCFDSGSDSKPEYISFAGSVADGYLDGATVCLDVNANKECDSGEPTATSGQNGAFTIDDATQAQRDQFPFIVEVVKGVTIDEDNPGVPLNKALTLSAPVGYGFISPLSTMVQNEVESGVTAEAAEKAVKIKLGTELNLDSDYIEGKESSGNAEEYEQLHQVAQVAARVISENMETLSQAAETNEISLGDLVSTIVNEVFDVLDKITAKVEGIAADNSQSFDPDAAATDVNDDFVDLAPGTIDAQVKQYKEEVASANSPLGVLAAAGVFIESDITPTVYLDFVSNGDGTGVFKIYEKSTSDDCYNVDNVELIDNGEGSFTMNPLTNNAEAIWSFSGGALRGEDESHALAPDQNVIAGLTMCNPASTDSNSTLAALAEAGVFKEDLDSASGKTAYLKFIDDGDDTGTYEIYEDDNQGCFELTEVDLRDNGSGSFTMNPSTNNINVSWYVYADRLYEGSNSHPLASNKNVLSGLNMCQ